MKIEIEPYAPIPEGWEAVRVGKLKQGDRYLSTESGEVVPAQESDTGYVRIILRRKTRTATFATIKVEVPAGFKAYAGNIHGSRHGGNLESVAIPAKDLIICTEEFPA